mmetsp:Transcript_11952/g.21030  ORF Transcript_11952/g.21030 Transcript_11952/m.21030 type:complete len:205 (-) Transcript_11952:481-1095(-)
MRMKLIWKSISWTHRLNESFYDMSQSLSNLRSELRRRHRESQKVLPVSRKSLHRQPKNPRRRLPQLHLLLLLRTSLRPTPFLLLEIQTTAIPNPKERSATIQPPLQRRLHNVPFLPRPPKTSVSVVWETTTTMMKMTMMTIQGAISPLGIFPSSRLSRKIKTGMMMMLGEMPRKEPKQRRHGRKTRKSARKNYWQKQNRRKTYD